MSDFKTHPMMLYKGEANRIVADEAEEKAARDDGWHDFGAEPKAAAKDSKEPKAKAAAKD